MQELLLFTADSKVFVYGSEYAKGTSNAGTSVDAAFEQFSNKPIILEISINVTVLILLKLDGLK